MNPPEILVLSIAVGIVVSFIFSEVYGLAAGGVVVPGYIALYLDRPYALALTMVVALGTFLFVRVLASLVIIYGRRRTSITILVGFALGAWLSRFDLVSSAFNLEDTDITVIGYIIPGLIAIWFDRQGIVPTASALAIGAVVVRLLLLLLLGSAALELDSSGLELEFE